MRLSRKAHRHDAHLLAALRLARSRTIGPSLWRRLVERFGDPQSALQALPDLAKRGGKREALEICTLDAAEAELEALRALGGRMLVLGEGDYPMALAAIADPPPILAVLGEIELLHRNSIGIVGARNASLNGRRIAGELADGLGAQGLVVVSGLARGIDTAAHQAALASGTIACVAGGIDQIYPAENEQLYRDIAGQGAIVAEAPLGAAPTARHFPRRNRVIAGLSLGTVVVEASLGSGSLITARLALEQDRDVFAVPGSPLDPRCRGSNDLLRQGAHLVENAADVMENLTPIDPHAPPAPRPARMKVVRQTEAPALEPIAPEALEKLLGPAPTEIDELVRRSGASAASVAANLLELELAGRLERHADNTVSLL